MTEARPETILKTDNKTVVFELERESKFVAKSAAWEDHKVLCPAIRCSSRSSPASG